jgi:hypothetical protein
MVAMSHSLNLEECANGIRSTVICPGDEAAAHAPSAGAGKGRKPGAHDPSRKTWAS